MRAHSMVVVQHLLVALSVEIGIVHIEARIHHGWVVFGDTAHFNYFTDCGWGGVGSFLQKDVNFLVYQRMGEISRKKRW